MNQFAVYQNIVNQLYFNIKNIISSLFKSKNEFEPMKPVPSISTFK